MAAIDEQMMGWIEAMQFMDSLDQVAAYQLCMEGEVRFGWEAFTAARKEHGACKDWTVFASKVEQNMKDAKAPEADASNLAVLLEEAIQALQVQADTMARLINSEAMITRERDEARRQANAADEQRNAILKELNNAYKDLDEAREVAERFSLEAWNTGQQLGPKRRLLPWEARDPKGADDA